MRNRKRLIALLLCAGLVLSLFASSACVTHAARHVCVGQGCRTCAHIASVTALLRLLPLLGAALFVLFAGPEAPHAFQAERRPAGSPSRTLVRWKVQLND